MDHFPSLHTDQPHKEGRVLNRQRAPSRGRSKSRERVSQADVTRKPDGKQQLGRDTRALQKTPGRSRGSQSPAQQDQAEVEALREALATTLQEFADYRKSHDALQRMYAQQAEEYRLITTRLQQLELNQQCEPTPRKEHESKNIASDRPGPAPKRRAIGTTPDKKDDDPLDRLKRVEQQMEQRIEQRLQEQAACTVIRFDKLERQRAHMMTMLQNMTGTQQHPAGTSRIQPPTVNTSPEWMDQQEDI